MQLIFISGAPATGKTTLGRRLAADLKYDFYSKDDYKTALHAKRRRVTLCYWAYCERLAKAWLYQGIANHLADRCSAIFESNFEWSERKRLQEMVQRHRQQVYEIYCRADGRVAARRYRARIGLADRHGHKDALFYPLMLLYPVTRRLGLDWHPLLGLSSRIQVIDTSDTTNLDSSYEQLLKFLVSPPNSHKLT